MIKNEHWRFKNNSFGLFRVDAKNTVGWDKVSQIVECYIKVHPNEMREQIESNKMVSETRKNRFASGQRMRFASSLPVGLVQTLERAEPKLFTDKKLFHQFLKKYPQFKTCKTL